MPMTDVPIIDVGSLAPCKLRGEKLPSGNFKCASPHWKVPQGASPGLCKRCEALGYINGGAGPRDAVKDAGVVKLPAAVSVPPGIIERLKTPCVHLGEPTGEERLCETCSGKKKSVLIHNCAKHGECVLEKLLYREDNKWVQGRWCAVCPDHSPAKPTNIVLTHHLAAGDSLVMTAAIESLHRQFRGKYRTAVSSNCQSLFANNPHVMPVGDSEEFRPIKMEYDVDEASKKPVHFIDGFCDHLGKVLGIPLRAQVNRPYVYLTEKEKSEKLVEGDYWLLNAGYKSGRDFTVKKWQTSRWVELVRRFAGRIRFVQVGERHHHHPPVEGAENLVGRFDGDARALLRLAHHARGAVTAESFLGHAMAAFQKPCVTLCSGYFPLHWVSYPNTKLVSHKSSMSCCPPSGGGCGRARVLPYSPNDTDVCRYPVGESDQLAKCMDLISVDEVASAVEGFYAGGRLP